MPGSLVVGHQHETNISKEDHAFLLSFRIVTLLVMKHVHNLSGKGSINPDLEMDAKLKSNT